MLNNVFKLGESLFRKNFTLYKPLYELYKSISDREEREFMKEIIRPGDCVLDIGANIGSYTKFFSKIVGEHGLVIAFEPDATNFSKLTKLKFKYNNVQAHNLAVGNKNEKVKFYLSSEYNVDHRAYMPKDEKERSFIEVKMITLDSFLTSSIREINFIKMDIQGFEYFALRGMHNLLMSNKNIKMILEFWPFSLKSSGSSARELLASLEAMGFKLKLLSHVGSQSPSEVALEYENDKSKYFNLYAFREQR
ncbi:MAG: hypothetical protein A2X86_18580 [Bdellovibrionales bacterium GWA2_49_15]|nr:MAG: hypothetical protein A2X86_18580 [Bdellovibrionales bacterium GWA2_49_15]HAZ11731.1 hypothetical protein [Bdellovibrionales bacterium]